MFSYEVGGISIHAAREGGDKGIEAENLYWGISIHAAREGGDTAYSREKCLKPYFNPRRP